MQLDKFQQELVVSNITMCVTHRNQQTCGVGDGFFGIGSRGCMSHGRIYGRGRTSFGNPPTRQLCGKHGQLIANCWHRFGEPLHFHVLNQIYHKFRVQRVISMGRPHLTLKT